MKRVASCFVAMALALVAGFIDVLPAHADAGYRLPYEPGRSFRVSQGPAGHAAGPYPAYNYHAIDFAMPDNTPVLASKSGTVNFEGWDSSRAIQIRIDHGEDRCSQYVHLSRSIVDRGQHVERGQLIGYSGHTGIGTGPHLHWNIVYCSSQRGRETPDTLEMGTNYPVGSWPVSQNSMTPPPPPPPPDRDGDGVQDSQDQCPDQAGTNNGCPDADGDGVRDSDDLCGNGSGPGFNAGCPTPVLNPGRSVRDFNGDGRADYCRTTGSADDPHVQCTVSTGNGFGSTYTSARIDWGKPLSRTWVDFTGDGRADFCRALSNSPGKVACLVSTGTGFGADITSPSFDWGFENGRAWADVNGDGRADFCRHVGGALRVDSHLQCTLSTGTGFGATFTSGVVDWGEAEGQAWVDFNNDGRSDYCRVLSEGPRRMACILSTGAGFGTDIVSETTDTGYNWGRHWTDVNGDGKTDFCRNTNSSEDQRLQCTLSLGSRFGNTFTSNQIEWGETEGRVWADATGDGRADYCRVISGRRLACLPFTGAGFGNERVSVGLDAGYGAGRSWVDANRDGRADYCRVVGGANITDAHVTCTLSTATGFGSEFTSGSIDWGFDWNRVWAGSPTGAPRVSITAPKDAAYGSKTVITGRLTTVVGAGLSRRTVKLAHKPAGEKNYKDLGSALTDARGNYSFQVPTGTGGNYYVSHAGAPSVQAANSKSVHVALRPGFLPLKGARPVATGRIGESTGDRYADVWAIGSTGNLKFHRYAPKALGSGALRGVGLGYISYMGVATDQNRDKRADLFYRDSRDQSLWFAYNQGNGYLTQGRKIGARWGQMDQIWYAGPMIKGSSKQFILARNKTDGSLWRYEITSRGLSKGVKVGARWNSLRVMLSPGNMYGDAAWDIVAIHRNGNLYGYQVVNGKLVEKGVVGRRWGSITKAFSPGDITGDGRLDMIAQHATGALYAYGNTTTKWTDIGKIGTGYSGYRIMA